MLSMLEVIIARGKKVKSYTRETKFLEDNLFNQSHPYEIDSGSSCQSATVRKSESQSYVSHIISL